MDYITIDAATEQRYIRARVAELERQHFDTALLVGEATMLGNDAEAALQGTTLATLERVIMSYHPPVPVTEEDEQTPDADPV